MIRKILKLTVLLNHILETTFGSGKTEGAVGAGFSIYILVTMHFLLYVLRLKEIFKLIPNFILVVFGGGIALLIIPLIVMIFLYNYKWTRQYYIEIYAMKISKNKCKLYTLFFLGTPVVYFYLAYLYFKYI